MVLLHGLARKMRLPALRDRDGIIAWLESDEGRAWARDTFDDPTECHEMIEIVDDIFHIDDHYALSSDAVFQRMREEPEWADLTWTPDRSP